MWSAGYNNVPFVVLKAWPEGKATPTCFQAVNCRFDKCVGLLPLKKTVERRMRELLRTGPQVRNGKEPVMNKSLIGIIILLAVAAGG